MNREAALRARATIPAIALALRQRRMRVRGFSYVLSRVDRLLGFGHVP